MGIIERLLGWSVLVGVVLFLAAAASLPIGCGYCLRAVLFENPIGRHGDIQVFAGPSHQRAQGASDLAASSASPASPGSASASVAARQVLTHLPEAKRRVVALLGRGGMRADVIAAPRVQFGDDIDYAGAMFGSLFGPPVIVLPQDSVGVDITAHELVHAVLDNRLGHWRADTDMPTWFNEGLATQVQLDGSLGLDQLCALAGEYPWPSAQSLRHETFFYGPEDRGQLVLHYAWSKAAVWSMMKDPAFADNLDAFLAGERWDQAFAEADLIFPASQLLRAC